ncbi:hypothetical protein B0H19DRAFT_1134165 [Mycena capillaripes]|nr:hypothetical protein B0H19DRAFT_1134165 [Mycena capillaripes]
MSLPALDTITGCLLIATWVSSLLWLFEITQGFYYFRHFKQDNWKLKTLVTVALFVDGLSTIGDYICVYLYTITHVGELEYLDNVHWPIPLYGFTTGVLAVLVQSFLVLRYWRFTQNTLIALFLSLAILISFGSVFTCALMLTLYSSFAERSKFNIPVGLWLVSELAVDAGITSALLWEFRKARKILIVDTRSVLDRLTAVTIQSGGVATTLAAVGLIAYYINPETNVSVSFLFPVGRVYVITLLSNLNIRRSEKKSFSTTGTSSGPGMSGGDPSSVAFAHSATDDTGGIHAHHTVHISLQVPTSIPNRTVPR